MQTLGAAAADPAPVLGPGPVPLGVLGATAVVAFGAALPLLFVLPHDTVSIDATLPLLAWLAVGIAGIVGVERQAPEVSRVSVGWAAVAAATTPLLVLGWSAVVSDAAVTSTTAGGSGRIDSGPWWTTPVLLLAAAATGAAATGDRGARRWRTWLVATAALTLAGSWVAWLTTAPQTYGVVTTAGLVTLACQVATAAAGGSPRPVDEPLLDVALVAGVLAVAAAAGGAVWWFTQVEQVFAGEVVATFAGAMSLILATPGAWWLRREFLRRRYGPGVLAADDVAGITADLRPDGDPRRLLDKAATMVAAVSGTAAARIELRDPTDPTDPTDPLGSRTADEEDRSWRGFPLVVGDEHVGVLTVRAPSVDGLEVRQERAIRQLVPTVALVARAVTSALEAEHARSDLTRERIAERGRILADLHDDLGPVLAGMSMRVEAARHATPAPTLDALAQDLATARADLRRIVAGLTPAALHGQEAGTAIAQLVDSFRTDTGPIVRLHGVVPPDLGPETALTVYRTIAEAVTNALRHASPTLVAVEVEQSADDGTLALRITDSGGRSGTPHIVPGVGLTSLRARAEALGGTLHVTTNPTVVRLTLPAADR